jgi:hypothetical protein
MMVFGFVQPEAIGNFLSTMFILGAGIVVISLIGDKASKGSWTMLII